MDTSPDCSVKVAVHIRPLIGYERIQNCKECVVVIPKRPQVQIGTHSFTFDHVYGSDGAPSSNIFEECISPLVDGLFQGYNATVLAYGQTGSGKTYTMGTGAKDGTQMGLIPQAMNALFSKIETSKHQTEFQLRVSFIEILKEEVNDLLDSVSLNKVENAGGTGKVITPGRQSIHIRETSNGAITLAGITEVSVTTLQEMALCLEHGSFSRATGSTNMNNVSSRSHAVFTITIEQMRKIRPVFRGSDDAAPNEDMDEEYVCAKLHLVDLAGSERAKRTGSDGLRLKEGIHINRGLLALGNVISALGDDRKRKECAHVPYRDSKLTRLLQDSLGGNSKTVMIACISPADINAEETLNTLKYANRARNIQNKPVANRDLISTDEIQRMRQQLEYLQAELCARGGATSHVEMQVLKERIARLESTNLNLCRELHEYRSRRALQWELDSHDGNACVQKSDGLKRGFHGINSSDYEMGDTGETRRVDVAGKEREHELLQNTLDDELNALNKRLEQKESEMRFFGENDTEALKHHFGKKILELEEEKRVVQRERDQLLAEVESLAANTDRQSPKVHDTHSQKLRSLEAQILELKKKQESQVQLIKEKHRIEEAAKRLQAEIRYIKAQKVQLQHKIKHEAEQFRQWKASREKELLQLRKEGRRNEYERHKLEALNQRQKMVLQRKTEEAAVATKRLKELLEFRKSARYSSVNINGQTQVSQNDESFLQRWLDHELEVVVNVHEVRFEYGKQAEVRCALVEELALLKQVEQLSLEGNNGPPGGNNRYSRSRVSSLSPDSRKTRIESVENMLSMSSNALIAMASQLSEAEERERLLICHGRWNQLRSMGDAKNLLQYMFNTTAEARCQYWEKNMEIKDMKDQIAELMTLLRISETQRKELLRDQKLKEQGVAITLAKSDSGNSHSSLADITCGPSTLMSVPAPKQLKFTPGIVRESAAFLNQTGKKMVPIGQVSMKNLVTAGQAGGKLWRWKRSHHQWLLQFKWKWQKPWRLSEWIKHSDETIIKPKPKSRSDSLVLM